VSDRVSGARISPPDRVGIAGKVAHPAGSRHRRGGRAPSDRFARVVPTGLRLEREAVPRDGGAPLPMPSRSVRDPGGSVLDRKPAAKATTPRGGIASGMTDRARNVPLGASGLARSARRARRGCREPG